MPPARLDCWGLRYQCDWSADINSKSPSETSSPNLQASAAASLLFPQNAPSSPQATNGRPRPMPVLWRQGFSHPPLFLKNQWLPEPRACMRQPLWLPERAWHGATSGNSQGHWWEMSMIHNIYIYMRIYNIWFPAIMASWHHGIRTSFGKSRLPIPGSAG